MSTGEKETWDAWCDGAHSPALNMALDEALLLTSVRRGRPLLRVYRWDRLAVSIGYIQRRDAAPAGFAVVRRPTGGGIVYHDHDFTYTVVVPRGHWLTGVDRTSSYGHINQAVSSGLRKCELAASLTEAVIHDSVDRGSMVCFEHPTKYDIVLNSQKVAGSAQRRTKEGIIHQGSIHFGGPLPVGRDTLTARLLDGFRDTLNVRFETFHPDEDMLSEAARLVTERYGCATWNTRH